MTFFTVPVKSPDDCNLLYKPTLLKIVQDCNASFVLGEKQFLEQLLGKQETPTTKYLTASLKSTSAEWLYEGYFAVGSEAMETVRKDTSKGNTSKEVCEKSLLKPVQWLEEKGVEEREELDKAQPQDVAFLQYINSGEA